MIVKLKNPKNASLFVGRPIMLSGRGFKLDPQTLSISIPNDHKFILKLRASINHDFWTIEEDATKEDLEKAKKKRDDEMPSTVVDLETGTSVQLPPANEVDGVVSALEEAVEDEDKEVEKTSSRLEEEFSEIDNQAPQTTEETTKKEEDQPEVEVELEIESEEKPKRRRRRSKK